MSDIRKICFAAIVLLVLAIATIETTYHLHQWCHPESDRGNDTVPERTVSRGTRRTITTRTTTQSDEAYAANIKTRKFHRSTCSYFSCTNCKAKFDTREEALEAGYLPCGTCNP